MEHFRNSRQSSWLLSQCEKWQPSKKVTRVAGVGRKKVTWLAGIGLEKGDDGCGSLSLKNGDATDVW